jgi:phage-related tail fiber protein
VIEQNDIDNRFTYHPPSETKATKHVMIRESGKTLTEIVNEMVPDGREKSLAITKIEEAVMWANAGLARTPDE